MKIWSMLSIVKEAESRDEFDKSERRKSRRRRLVSPVFRIQVIRSHEPQQEQPTPSLEDCLKLLKGERDEQRLAGLLLVTKFCDKDDHASIRRVYDAVGVQFLNRLLKTGMGNGGVSGSGGENREAYLQLSITVLAAFCRVPEIASSEDMVSKIPLILEIMSKEPSVLEECYEFLFLVSDAHKDGVSRLNECGGLTVLASQMSNIPDGSQSVEFSLRLVQLLITTLSLDTISNEYPAELAMMVAAISKQFAVLHDALKFEALHLLSAIMSSKHSAPLHEALRSMNHDIWSTFIRVGVVAILQNRVAPIPFDLGLVEWAKPLICSSSSAIPDLMKECSKGDQDSSDPNFRSITQANCFSSVKPFQVVLFWNIGIMRQDKAFPDKLTSVISIVEISVVLGLFISYLSSSLDTASPAEKIQALILVESVISIVGEGWLIGQMNLASSELPVPADRCMLLVLESSRVEVAVLLDELAYLKYEASKNSSSNSESGLLKQRNLAVVFSLVERIIKLISNIGGDEDPQQMMGSRNCLLSEEGSRIPEMSIGLSQRVEDTLGSGISESTIMKVISGLNETIGVVLEYLQDAKDHGQTKGDDLLASVRVVGSYLAETPLACEEKVRELLGFMLSIKGEDESSPFYSVCFLLPMLCQTTMEDYGCKVLVSSGAYKATIAYEDNLNMVYLGGFSASVLNRSKHLSFHRKRPSVVECLIKLVGPDGSLIHDNGSIFLACDTVVNLLLKRDQIQVPLDDACFVRLLGALAYWTGDTDDLSAIMMASTICALIFDSTSEEALLQHPSFDKRLLNSLSQLIARSLAISGKEILDEAKAEADLHQIVSSDEGREEDMNHASNLCSKASLSVRVMWFIM
ncbi:hypothetical protein C3L33_15927, partial [Rhododendron williamsianum]